MTFNKTSAPLTLLLLVFSGPVLSTLAESSGHEGGCVPGAGGGAAESRCRAEKVDATLLIQKKIHVRNRDRAQHSHSDSHSQNRTAVHSGPDPDCTDDDAAIVEKSAAYCKKAGEGCEVSACVDVGGYCGRQAGDPVGEFVRATCCATCTGVPVPEDSLPPADTTVQLFVQSGQSECVGAASADRLPKGKYPDLVGDQDGVWFAGYADPAGTDRFFLARMKPGNEKDSFGAEIGLGQRLHAVTGAPTLIVKYCWGGTNVETNWNPETADNSWDHDADDGSASWLLTDGGVDLGNINALYKNLIYTVRRATEALTQASIPFEYKGIFWVQGQADALRSWKDYGEDLARVWDSLRDDLGQPNLPIVDTGASLKNNLRSGKAYAGSLVSGCKVKTVELALASENPACIPGPGDACEDSTYWNNDVFNHYGYDPKFKQSLRKDGASSTVSSKVFKWWVAFPKNSHSQYDGMVLMGRMLADAYIDTFVDGLDVPADMAAEDAAVAFPWDPCNGEEDPSAENICWKDQRDDAAKALEANCAFKPWGLEGD